MRTTLFAFIAALGLIAAPAIAQQPAPPPAPPMGGPGAMAGDSAEFGALGLSADQRAKIKAIREQLQQQNAPLRDQIRQIDRKSTRLNSSHMSISYAVFCL